MRRVAQTAIDPVEASGVSVGWARERVSPRRGDEILRIAGDHKRFLDFVRYHRFRVRDLLTDESGRG